MSRYPVVITVPEALLKGDAPKRVQKRFKALYRDTLGRDAKPFVVWQSAPDGQIFVARKPSRNATIIAALPDDFAQSDREQFIHRVLDIWTTETGSDKFHTVISGTPITKVREVVGLSRARPAPEARRKIALKTVGQLLSNWLTKGRFEMSVNMD